MKRTTKIAMLAVLFLLVYSGSALAAGAKIAYVDLQRALLEVEEGKSAKSKLKGYFDEKQALLDKEMERLKKQKDDLEKQSMMIDPTKKAEKEAELQKALIEAQKLYYQLQNELQTKQSEAVEPIVKKMQEILREIAEREGYDLILDKNSSGIVYAPMKFDLSNELIRVYDERHGKGGKKK